MAIEFFGKSIRGGRQNASDADVSVSLNNNPNSSKSYQVNNTMRKMPRRLQNAEYAELGFDDRYSERLYIQPSTEKGYKISHPNKGRTASIRTASKEKLTEWAKDRVGDFHWEYDDEQNCYYIMPSERGFYEY